MDRLFFVGLLVCAVAAGSAYGQERPLVVLCETYPPYEYLKDGEPTGINVDVTRRIMKEFGIPVTFEFVPFSRALMRLRRGDADAVMSVSYKAEREDFLIYTDEQRRCGQSGIPSKDVLWPTTYVFFVRRQVRDALTFTSYDQLKQEDYRIGVLQDYSYDEKFRKARAGLNTKEYPTPIEALKALSRGEIDMVPMDVTVGQWLLKENQLHGDITYLPIPIFTKGYNLLFCKKSDVPDLDGLTRRFYDALADMHRTGEYQTILDTYLPPREKQDVRPLIFICEEWAPFEYIEDGNVVGLDAEVVAHIMGRLGLPYEIKIYPWSRAKMMYEHGKADVVLSVSYKPSRETFLYYTPCQRRVPVTGLVCPHSLWLSEYVFFLKKKFVDSYRFQSFEQIRKDGYRIGLNRDYSYSSEFVAADLGTVEFTDTAKGLNALVAEEIDLYPMDKMVGLAELKRMGLSDSVTYLPRPLFSKPYLAAFCRLSDYPQLDQVSFDFYQELIRLRQSGLYDTIYKKYCTELR